MAITRFQWHEGDLRGCDCERAVDLELTHDHDHEWNAKRCITETVLFSWAKMDYLPT